MKPARNWRFGLRYASVFLGGASCAVSESDSKLEGRYVDLTVESGIQACAGATDDYDRFIERSFHSFEGRPPPSDWRANLRVRGAATFHDETPCVGTQVGCVRPGEAWTSETMAAYHELLHLVVDQPGTPRPALFSEGLASNWGGSPFSRYAMKPGTLEDLFFTRSSTELLEASGAGYPHAAAFSHVLATTYGLDAYLAFFHSIHRDDSDAAIVQSFESVFGTTPSPAIDGAESDLQCNTPMWFCDDAERVDLPLEIHTAFTCDDPETRGFLADDSTAYAPFRVYQFEIAEPTMLEMSIRSVGVRMLACGACDAAPIEIRREPDESDMLTFPVPTRAGTWTVMVSILDESAAFFDLREAPPG